jgi:small subunit ribosomal protein S2
MGGTLTNFQTILTRIRRLEELEQRRDAGEFTWMTKKEAIKLQDELDRLERLLGGMRKQYRLPQAVFVVDPHREHIAVAESRRCELTIVAMVDTNCNPLVVDYPIPSNDDAIRAIRLLAAKIADAAIEGAQQHEAQLADRETDAVVMDAEEYEGPLVSGMVFTPDDFAPGESAEVEPDPRRRRTVTSATDEPVAEEAPVAEPAATEAPASPAPATSA